MSLGPIELLLILVFVLILAGIIALVVKLVRNSNDTRANTSRIANQLEEPPLRKTPHQTKRHTDRLVYFYSHGCQRVSTKSFAIYTAWSSLAKHDDEIR